MPLPAGSDSNDYGSLPSGWETRVDPAGRRWDSSHEVSTAQRVTHHLHHRYYINHNNRTTQAANKLHSSNTLQTSRFASVRPLDNLARKSYVNQAIQRVEITNQHNPDLDPGDSPSDPSDLSSASDNNNGNDSDILFEPSDIDSNNSEATKRCKKCTKRK